jgi:thioredoxin-dependent peroxiredoxin
MKKNIIFAATIALSITLATQPAIAALKPGATAATFATDAALGGRGFTFDMAKALKKGPVVLYFYPKAFTSGCTVEAHEFAEATDDFAKMGATVVGISADDIDTLKKFSVEECRNKFAVGVGTQTMIRSYDAGIPGTPMSNRITYVIAPDSKVVFAYVNGGVNGHVSGALQAVKDWRTTHPYHHVRKRRK